MATVMSTLRAPHSIGTAVADSASVPPMFSTQRTPKLSTREVEAGGYLPDTSPPLSAHLTANFNCPDDEIKIRGV